MEIFFLCGLAALLCGLLGNTRPLKALALAMLFLTNILLLFYNLLINRALGLPPGEAGLAGMLLISILFLAAAALVPPLT